MTERLKSKINRRNLLTGTSKLAGAAAFGGLLTPFANTAAQAKFLPNPDAKAVVDTTSGMVRGGIADGIHIFRGIPYGASTEGAGRFKPATEPGKWTGIKDAMAYGNTSPQVGPQLSSLSPLSLFGPFWSQEPSEDCLYLNVWTPGVNKRRGKRPVLVWLHGGAYANGSGASSLYEGTNMAKRGDVVVVTINHRLNAFGYTHLGDLAGEEFESSGNVGMLDIVKSLEWVRDNIKNFGGDPDNVLIFGESGGGWKVSTLMAMPAAKGLFHRAVIQSGPVLRVGTREDGTRSATYLMEELGLQTSQIDKLQAVPYSELVKAQAKAAVRSRREGIRGSFAPVLGADIPAHPFDPVASELSKDVPVLIGTTLTEATLFNPSISPRFKMDEADLLKEVSKLLGDKAQGMIDVYRAALPHETPSGLYFIMASDRMMRIDSIKLAEAKHAQGGAPVHMYRFDWESSAWDGNLRAAHAFEIPFVFSNTQLVSGITGGTPDAFALGARMSDAWIAFAHEGNPNHKGLPKWPKYNPDTRATMLFNDECAIENDPGGAEREAWAAL